ncbi:MAG: hypothetical protein RL205_84 [Actinomycetota bacterium]|jgi:hypothetical protein
MRFSSRIAAAAVSVLAVLAVPVAARASTPVVTPSYLFTVQATGGSTVKAVPIQGQNERFTLSLTEVSPVTKFADRPFRNAAVLSPSALVSNWNSWFASSPPNAVLTYSPGQARLPQSIVVTLTRPHYDPLDRTLSFTASRTYRSLDPSEKGQNWSRPATPRTFTHASLFIDDAGSSVTDSLVAQLQQAMQPYVFASNDMATWQAVTQSLSAILNSAWQAGSLAGATAANAFTVTCMPTTQQILNGYLPCSVTMQLPGGTSYSTTITQQMGSAG